MSAALKPVPRQPQVVSSKPIQVERLAPRMTPQELRPAAAGQLTRFPSRSELVQRRKAESALQPPQRRSSSVTPVARRTAKKSLANHSAVVRSFPNQQTLPNWLKLLLALQQASGPLSLILVTAALVAYGWTVHVQQIWSNNFQQLEQLQQKERTLTAFGQMVNHQIAKQADSPDSNLAMPGPQNTIFLEPPAPLPTAVTQPPMQPPVAAPVEFKAPMGY